MNEELYSADTCAICGGPVSRERACHLYPAGECVTLCGPACVQDFLLDSHHQGTSHVMRSFLQEAVDERRWQPVSSA